MTRSTHHGAPVVLAAIASLAAVLALLPGRAGAQEVLRVGTSADPVVAATQLDDARIASPGHPGPADRVVIGRSDVFADNLAATALAGADGALLLTDGGPDAALRPEVAEQIAETLTPGGCDDGQGPAIVLAGGVDAVSAQVEQQLVERFAACVVRLAGPTRIQTAIAIAEAVPDPSGTVVLARADDWADAGAVGAWAAATRSPVLVTPTGQLLPDVADALERMAPAEIVVVGGELALSQEVADAASRIAPVRRVAGEARDGTAVAIAEQLWDDRTNARALADGYDAQDWTYLFAGAPLAALRRAPMLYTADDVATPATQAHLDAADPDLLLRLGPGGADLDAAQAVTTRVAVADAPLMLKARPGVGELWVAERAGRVVALSDTGQRTVLDISDTVSSSGERGLLGLAFNPDGTRLYTSSTDPSGHSVIDEFAIVGDSADARSRREIIQVDQPASNHNGGDLQWGPDGYLWWALGDGGGGGDTYGNGQRADTLLGTLVRIDVAGVDGAAGQPYAIPPDNPFADGVDGAPEVWAYGLRNPFRFDFDDATGELYIADVGQGAVEEIDWLPASAPGGANFGWAIFEGDRGPSGGPTPDDYVAPVWTEPHADGNCSITGGVVYRGQDMPELAGAYLYSDLCRSSIRAILVQDGRVVQDTDLGVSVEQPVGFGTDHDGEVYVLSLRGDVVRLAPAGQ